MSSTGDLHLPTRVTTGELVHPPPPARSRSDQLNKKNDDKVGKSSDPKTFPGKGEKALRKIAANLAPRTPATSVLTLQKGIDDIKSLSLLGSPELILSVDSLKETIASGYSVLEGAAAKDISLGITLLSTGNDVSLGESGEPQPGGEVPSNPASSTGGEETGEGEFIVSSDYSTLVSSNSEPTSSLPVLNSVTSQKTKSDGNGENLTVTYSTNTPNVVDKGVPGSSPSSLQSNSLINNGNKLPLLSPADNFLSTKIASNNQSNKDSLATIPIGLQKFQPDQSLSNRSGSNNGSSFSIDFSTRQVNDGVPITSSSFSATGQIVTLGGTVLQSLPEGNRQILAVLSQLIYNQSGLKFTESSAEDIDFVVEPATNLENEKFASSTEVANGSIYKPNKNSGESKQFQGFNNSSGSASSELPAWMFTGENAPDLARIAANNTGVASFLPNSLKNSSKMQLVNVLSDDIIITAPDEVTESRNDENKKNRQGKEQQEQNRDS